jgi:hypothetical protein
MIQRLKDSTDESVAHTLQQERLERAAKTERLRELRLERDREAAAKEAKVPTSLGKKKIQAVARRLQRKKPVPE